MSEKKDSKKVARVGSVEPEDAALTEWLHRLWHRNEYPQRIEVWQMFGRNKAIRGEMIHHEDFKPNDKLDVERCNKLANEIIEAAQNDCDASRTEASFQIAVIDTNRKASPLTRRLGPLMPKRSYALTKGVLDEEDDDGKLSTKLLLGLLQEERRDKRYMSELAMNVVSGVVERQDERISRMEAIVDGTWAKQATMMAATERALSTAADRQIKTSWNELKLAGVRDGISVLKGLLPGTIAVATAGRIGTEAAIQSLTQSLTRGQISALVGGNLDAPTGNVLSVDQSRILARIDRGETALVGELFGSLSPEQLSRIQRLMTRDQLVLLGSIADALRDAKPNGVDGANGANSANGAQQAQEPVVVAKFLDSLNEAASLELFGHWEASNASDGMACVSPGILSDRQFLCMARVAKHRLPPSAIDALLPGGELALSDEQQQRARAILPPAAVAALSELVALRMKAQQANGEVH
jgi:hypothetical protein